MNPGPKLAVVALAAGAVLAVSVPISTAAPAQEPPGEAAPILAIVSPFAFSGCSAAGGATLLVPVLGGFAQDQLGLGDTVTVGDVILDGLGPVFIVCGALPAAPGRRCQLDNELAALYPGDLSDLGAPSPPLGGATADSLEAGLAALGLPPQAALQEALQCDVPPPAPVPEPGVAPPRPSVPTGGSHMPPRPSGEAPVTPTPGTPTSVGDIPQTGPTAGPAAIAPDGPVRRTLVDLASRHLPGGILALQLIVAALLALFLTGSWLSSWRLTTTG